jgi:amidase
MSMKNLVPRSFQSEIESQVLSSEYAELDATDLAGLVRARQVSVAEVLEHATDMHESTHADINAVVEWYDSPEPCVNPEGPLAGVPFLRKDYGSTEQGRLVEMGSRLALGNTATSTSVFFRKLKAAGAVVVGRSAVPEFIQHGSTETTLFGATRNPHRTDLSAGGSSGGSGAAVAAGVVPAASASDCAGSIRIPAATCGLRRPAYPSSWSRTPHVAALRHEETATAIPARCGLSSGQIV